MEPAALDFSVTLKNIGETSKLLALSATNLTDAQLLFSRLRQFLSDQQAAVEYVPLYVDFLQSSAVLSQRFPQLGHDHRYVCFFRCLMGLLKTSLLQLMKELLLSPNMVLGKLALSNLVQCIIINVIHSNKQALSLSLSL